MLGNPLRPLWVFGAWGEASEEVRGLVQRLANSRLEVADMQPGNRGKARTKLRASRIDWLHQKAAVFHCSPAAGQAPPRHKRLHLVSCSVCVVVIQSTVHSPANRVNKPSPAVQHVWFGWYWRLGRFPYGIPAPTLYEAGILIILQ